MATTCEKLDHRLLRECRTVNLNMIDELISPKKHQLKIYNLVKKYNELKHQANMRSFNNDRRD